MSKQGDVENKGQKYIELACNLIEDFEGHSGIEIINERYYELEDRVIETLKRHLKD